MRVTEFAACTWTAWWTAVPGSFAVIAGRATVTCLIPHSFVLHGFMLSGPIRVTADGHQVKAVSILG